MGSACSLCFPLKTAQGLRISSNFIRQKLQRDKTTELGVLGLVDQTHPAAAEPLVYAAVAISAGTARRTSLRLLDQQERSG